MPWQTYKWFRELQSLNSNGLVNLSGSKFYRCHTKAAIVFHWVFVALYAYGILKQIDDLSQLEDGELFSFEVVFALIFLLFVVVRFFYMRQFSTLLGAGDQIHPIHRYFAKLVHLAMYLSLVLLPLSGLMIAALYQARSQQPLVWELVIGLHEVAASISYLLIGIHVLAALYSRIKGDGVWSSMVPIWKEQKRSDLKIIRKLIALENQVCDRLEKRIVSSDRPE